MKKSFKKIVSLFILFTMLVSNLTFLTSIVNAATDPVVSITRSFNLSQGGTTPTSIKILIEDNELSQIPFGQKKVSVIPTTNSPHQGTIFPTVIEHYTSYIEFTITQNVEIERIVVTNSANPSESIVYSGISENSLAKVSTVVNTLADGAGPISLNGTKLATSIESNKSFLKIKVGGKTANYQLIPTDSGNLEDEVNLVPEANTSFDPGVQNILFSITKAKTDGAKKIGNNQRDYSYTLEFNDVYVNAVEIMGKLALDGIQVIPAVGQPGDHIVFKRNPLSNYDVYFVTNVADRNQFNQAHKAKYVSYGKDENNNDQLIVEVPKLPEGPGQYKIVITNENSLQTGIKNRYVLTQEFTYIEATKTSRIRTGITPLRAPQLISTEVTIPVEFVQVLDLQGYGWTQDKGVVSFNVVNDSKSGVENGVLQINYGKYPLTFGGVDKGEARVTRDIRVYIGGQASIDSDKTNTFPKNGESEYLYVKTPVINDLTQFNHKVRVSIDTKIEILDVNNNVIETITLPTKNLESQETFTYVPSTETPIVTSVVPNVIPVEEGGAGQYYISSKVKSEGDGTSVPQLEINIIGSNFLVTRINNKVRYPKIQLGNKIIIDPNDPSSAQYKNILSFEVYKGNTRVDGTVSNEIGDRILIKIKTGQDSQVPLDINDIGKNDVRITNPMRNNEGFSATITFPEMFEFVIVDSNDYPIITSVDPTVVGADSKEPVTITGSNFKEGAKLYIDGKEVTGIKISPNNDKINFNAPIGRPDSIVQLIVQNPGGGIATWPFTFTSTYTNPEFTDLNPKKGGPDTAVLIKGNNLKGFDPTIDASRYDELEEHLIYRLIGTRVFMNSKDINRYNIVNGKITLTEFSESKNYKIKEDIIIKTGDLIHPLAIANDYKSTILLERNQDGTAKKFYALTYDTNSRRVKMYDGFGKNYYFKLDGNEIIAQEYGSLDPTVAGNTAYAQYKVVFPEKGKMILNNVNGSESIEVVAYTPFYISEVYGEKPNETFHAITGNRVFYNNPTELTFYVPDLGDISMDCDVKIVNPDTKSVEKKKIFQYIGNPITTPTVVSFSPTSGSTNGGTTVTFVGPDDLNDKTTFIDEDGRKTRVWIGEKEVPSSDVLISNGGKIMVIKTPSYEEITGIETKNIIIINPDGGSFKITSEYPLILNDGTRVTGFTYIKTSNDPEISAMLPNQGPASGGNVVEIWGSNFKDWEPYTKSSGKEVATIKIIKDRDGADWISSFYKDENNNGVFDPGVDKVYDGGMKQSKYDASKEYIDSPLLPKVYFGEKLAEIIEFKPEPRGYMKVIVPPGTGTVQVTIENNDASKSTGYKYTYTVTKPTVKSIVPAVGRRQGGTTVEIIGTGFDKNAEVQFGNPAVITNKNISRNAKNSGLNGIVSLANMRFEYNSQGKQLKVILTEGEKTYEKTYQFDGKLPDGKKYINTLELVDKNGANYNREQLIKVAVNDDISNKELFGRLIVEMGYAPSVIWESESILKVTTPSYHESGEVSVIVTNPDGGQATSRFNYTNPDSKPRITNITKDGENPKPGKINNEDMLVHQVSYRGGNILTIIGEDFRENAIIQIGDILTFTPNQIEYELPNRLRVTMPALNENTVGKLYRVTVVNEDGASASSDKLTPPIYIQIVKGETNPVFESITPAFGPVKGGTEVTITGKDFREYMDGYEGKRISVYFGEVKVPDKDVKFIDYKTLKVITPPNVPGKVAVKVVNPDGEIAQPIGSFTYLSSPIISLVVDPLDTSESTRITTISVEGGEVIKLKGTSFATGARVVFAPVLRKAEDSEINNANAVNIGGEWYILESGADGTEVNVINSETLTVKTPQGKEGTKGIIVINPDRGASPIYDDLVYGLPQLKPPAKVEAELVYDRYIKVHWTPVSGARGYEIYVVINNKQTEFVGNTDLTSFVYEDLEPNTRYKFIIKTIGEYGLSIASNESNTVRTGRVVGPPDTDGGLTENTTTTKTGNVVNIVIGTGDYNKKDLVFDLTKLEYAGADKTVITISAEIIAASDAKNITIINGDYSLTFNPKAFAHSNVVSNKDKKDAGVRFTIENNRGDTKTGTQSTLSNQYLLYADFFIGNSSTKIENLKSNMTFTLDYDSAKADLRRAKEVYLGRYDDYSGTWENLVSEKVGFNSSIKATINKLGRYTIIGKRG